MESKRRVWRVIRRMRHPADRKPAGNEVTGSCSAVDNPVTSFPAGGGVEAGPTDYLRGQFIRIGKI